MSARFTSQCLFLFLLAISLPARTAGLDDADQRLYKVQLAQAEQGNARAQYYLGEMHEQGLGTKQDIDEAFKWYAKAAEQGDPLAKRKLAHRNEIVTETRKEQTTDALKSAPPAVKSKNPVAASKNTGPATQVVVTQTDQRQNEEEEKIKAAQREKRRAAVRAMILERIRNPAGELFE